jgi:ATP-dependent Clp protease protease subunit
MPRFSDWLLWITHMRIQSEHGPVTAGPEGADRDALRQRLLEQRIVLLGGPLDDTSSGDLIAEMLLLSSADPRSEIRLYINSAGGTAGAFLALYDTMNALAAPVVTVCMSQAKGTAALLLAAGRPGKRLSFRHATILMKLPDERLEGFDDIEAQVEEVRRRRRSLVDIAARHTGADNDQVGIELERGMLLTAEEAKQYGIVDAVIDPGHPYFVRFPVPPQPGGNGG